MNIIICDDRIDDRKNLSDLLSDYGEKKNYEFAITEYESGEQLCEEQSALEACQLLFLDINMQGMDGLKTAMRIKEKYPKLPVVLVTAYMNYALDGYKVKASRFLLKDNLADTIEECMDDLIAEINKNRRILEFRFVEGTIKLYADDIIYIETELHKNVFYTEKGTFQIYKKLDELEKHHAVGYLNHRTGRTTEWFFTLDGGDRAIRMREVLIVDDTDAYIQAGIEGVGLIRVASYLAMPYLQSGELVSCLENSTSKLPLSLVYPYSRYIPPSVRAFYDWSRTMLSHPDNRQ